MQTTFLSLLSTLTQVTSPWSGDDKASEAVRSNDGFCFDIQLCLNYFEVYI